VTIDPSPLAPTSSGGIAAVRVAMAPVMHTNDAPPRVPARPAIITNSTPALVSSTAQPRGGGAGRGQDLVEALDRGLSASRIAGRTGAHVELGGEIYICWPHAHVHLDATRAGWGTW
jgi:hypothetical protein